MNQWDEDAAESVIHAFHHAAASFRQGRDVVTDSMIFSPWELEHLTFNAEFIASVKARSFASVRLAGEGESTVLLEIERFVGAEPFSAREIEALRLLLPHAQRAGELGLRLAVQLGGLIDAVSTFNCGVLLLDSRGRVLSMNSNAEAILGPEIFVRGGTLTASNKDCDADLQKLMGSVTARGPRHEAKPVAAVRISWLAAGDLLGSRLIKSTIPGRRRGRQRPSSCAPICHNALRCAGSPLAC